ncbi:COPII coat assembly protein sec16 [Cyphellophora attinorum]|uniref:Protein transport protein sec16 n=1 Tax=Cyphellophora attinorum TaxID=1664694 RepID=A0A0N1H6J5_9EURO|nr:COPII coat assembly protein sec16 [Phialophora attinorum]KPI41677.1 COPII coat assembly protein sec16 [Phialophora attinorum]
MPMSAPPHRQTFTMQDDDEIEDDDDNERLDPAWGIKRMSTSQILNSVKRTSSFPDMSSTIDRTDADAQLVPEAGSVQTTEEPAQQPSRALMWDTAEDAEADAVFGQSEPLSAAAPEPTPDEVACRRVMAEDPAMQTADDGIEDTSFFDKSHAGPEEDTVPELTRKDTSTVLSGLHMEQRPPPESIAEEQDFLRQPTTEEQDFFNQPTAEEQDLSSQPTAEKPTAENTAPNTIDPFSEAMSEEPFDALIQPKAEENDPWQAMLAEDDEFLVDDPDDLLPDSDTESPTASQPASQPASGISQKSSSDAPSQRPFPPRKSSSMYAPHQPTTSELAAESLNFQGVGLNQNTLPQRPSFGSQFAQQRPQPPQQTSSFADQAKGGYKSPYDLPMELSKPKRRPAVLQQPSTTKAVPPPPRSASISEKPPQSPFSTTAQMPQPTATASVAKSTSTSRQSSFFEELPITTKPRAGSGGGRYTPQQGQRSVPPPPMASPPMVPPQPYGQSYSQQQPLQPQHIQPPVQHQQTLPSVLPAQMQLPFQPYSQPQLGQQAQQMQPPVESQQPSSQSSDPYAQFQLRAPDRLDPFSNQPLSSDLSTGSVPAAMTTRYSPAPPASLTAPRTGPSPRYSPAPPSQGSRPPAANRYASQGAAPAPSQPPQLNRYASQPPQMPSPPTGGTLPFQPRTSSPLVHQKSIDQTNAPDMQSIAQVQAIQPPQYAPQNIYSSPPPANQSINPPRRSQTQSPSKQRPQATPPAQQRHPGFRPASAHGHVAPMRSISEVTPVARPNLYNSGVTEQYDFIRPTDEQQADPLERWKGAPVFRFGFGGKVISTFPKHVPRFSAGATRPLIKPTVGDVLLREAKTVVPTPAELTSFPGPLRTKSKKKELLSWLQKYISHLESETTVLPTEGLPDARKRQLERIMLWKILKSMVEHDGALDSGEALKAVNAILSPEIHAVEESTASQYREDISPSIYRPSGVTVRPDSVDPMTLDAVRKHLLRGNRKEAVWHAVDNRLWSNALLIASTMPRDTWKQVVHEFVKQEVKTAGENTESLSTLYEIFGGNAEDCVDQLVPPSARAGLQMVSRIDAAGPTKNALDALDKWRETLSLVVNNRSHGDHQALSSLGRLLAQYGRIEAAHICFIFSRSAANPTIVGGLDDPHASIVLLGADHHKQPSDFARDREAVLLTEIYEFATLILTGSAVTLMPFLSTYKLQLAQTLADEGFKAEAQAYCDALTSTLKSAKVSAYYPPAFLGELEDFSNRLKQIPVQSSSSWMGKPNVEKVTGSLLSKLSNFVAGEDSDADSRASNREASESGPFANVTGTPSLSRTASQSEMNGFPMSTPQAIPSTFAGSRYAPNGLASARSSSELTRGRPSLDSQRSPPSTSYANGRPSPYEPVNMMQQSVGSPPPNPYQSFATPATNRYQSTPPQSSYMPNATSAYSPEKQRDVHDSYIPTPPPEQSSQTPYEPAAIPPTSYAPSQPMRQTSYEPSVSQYAQPIAQGPDVGGPVEEPVSSYERPGLSQQPSFGGYAPPEQSVSFMSTTADKSAPEPVDAPSTYSYGGYDPPADTGYQPYVPEPDSPEEPKPKRPQFGDDDNFSSVAAPAEVSRNNNADDEAARRKANDAAAEAAFRAAAEADAAADPKHKTVKSKSSGWFGGWLGGKKEDGALDAAPAAKGGKEPAVYRAKLGESKMKLYYDKDLKKWVNPDNPDAAKAGTATPPPPRAASGTPSMGGVGGGMRAPPPMGPPRSVSAMPSMPSMASLGSMGPPSGPPSRTGTPASATSSAAGGGMPAFAPTLPPNVTAALAENKPLGGPGGLAPPSRPGTATSNASSIDDLLGAGTPLGGGKRGAKKAPKKGRYVDVMAK